MIDVITILILELPCPWTTFFNAYMCSEIHAHPSHPSNMFFEDILSKDFSGILSSTFFQRPSLVFFVTPLRPLLDLARCVPHQKVVEPAVLFNLMSAYCLFTSYYPLP